MIARSLALAMVIWAAVAGPGHAQPADTRRTLSLTGHGEVRARPDMAIVNVGVLSTGLSAREALDANTRSMTAILAALKANGIEDRDIQTSNFQVAPRYDYGQNTGQPPRLVGYDVTNTVAVTLRKLDRLGALLDSVVGLGSNQINGIAFALDNPEPRRDEARREAVADARRKADLYSSAVGVELGPVVSISESASIQPPIPVFAKARMEAADGAAVPVAEGEQSIAIDVAITWEIR